MKKNDNNSTIKIFISMHKPSYVPNELNCLCPIQVGTILANDRIPNIMHDDEGENISKKNRQYCELTAQYFAWKNIEADYYGFWHYRRYFSFDESVVTDKWGVVSEKRIDQEFLKRHRINDETIKKYIRNQDIVLAKEWEIDEGNGNITVIEHWCRHFPTKDIYILINVVNEFFPDYADDLHDVLFSGKMSFCNLFIMRKVIFNEYCEWLFQILNECEKRSDYSKYNVEETRILGHLAERLLPVFVLHKKRQKPDLNVGYLPTILVKDTTPMAYITPIKTKKKYVAVALASNDEFVSYVSVLLASIRKNSNDSCFYDISIMHRDISIMNQNFIQEEFCSADKMQVRFLNVSRNFEKYSDIYISRHLSVETYYRFMILDIYQQYKKVLYLDSDMVADCDISELYNTDIGQKAIGAVRDIDYISASKNPELSKIYAEEIYKYVGFDNPAEYFQAGTILFNLEHMRAKYSTEKMFKIATSRSWYYHDQDVLNAVFNGDVFYLDFKWNVYSLLEPGSPREKLIKENLYSVYMEDYNKARLNPGIIHFAGTPKPWYDKTCDLSIYFWRYARISPYYERLLNELNYRYILPFGSIVFEIAPPEDGKSYGVPIFDLCYLTDLWSESYFSIEFLYLSEHMRKEICRSVLFVSVSVVEDEKRKKIIVSHFNFSNADYDYLLKDNIGFRIEKDNKIRVYARNVGIYEGYSWRVRELQSRSRQKPSIRVVNDGNIHNLMDLVNIEHGEAYKCEEDGFGTAYDDTTHEWLDTPSDKTVDADFLQYRINEIEASFSYKLGLFLTMIPRKIRALIRRA